MLRNAIWLAINDTKMPIEIFLYKKTEKQKHMNNIQQQQNLVSFQYDSWSFSLVLA